MNTDPTNLFEAKFNVESTDPHAPDDRRDERFTDLSIADAACRVEDLTEVVRRGDVFTELAQTDRFEWECPESGVTVTAERVVEEAGDMLAADGLGAEPVAVGGRP